MPTHVGPMCNGEWSPSDIDEMKSLIVKHNNMINHGDCYGMNSKHGDIMDVLQARFPWKEKLQVTHLYLDIMVEMMQCQEKSGTGPAVRSVDLVVKNNIGTSVKDPSMGNMEMMRGSLTIEDTTIRKVVQKPSRRLPAVQPTKHNKRFWSIEEHKLFLRGLRVYGRGDWKNISTHFVKTRTPLQVSSHAQKYFRRLEGTTARQRHSINDVGLYDDDPWMSRNSIGWEAPAFTGSSYNLNDYITHGQASTQPAMNNLTQVWPPFVNNNVHASTSQTTFCGDHQQMRYSAAPPPMEGTVGNVIPRDQPGALGPQQ